MPPKQVRGEQKRGGKGARRATQPGGRHEKHFKFAGAF